MNSCNPSIIVLFFGHGPKLDPLVLSAMGIQTEVVLRVQLVYTYAFWPFGLCLQVLFVQVDVLVHCHSKNTKVLYNNPKTQQFIIINNGMQQSISLWGISLRSIRLTFLSRNFHPKWVNSKGPLLFDPSGPLFVHVFSQRTCVGVVQPNFRPNKIASNRLTDSCQLTD